MNTIRFLSSSKFLVVLLISIGLLSFFLVHNKGITPSTLIITKNHSPNIYQFGLTSPISLGTLSNPKNSYINLRLNFYIDNLNGYQNLFQTAPGNEGLRLEISGTTAALVVSDKLAPNGVMGLLLSSGINANQWYELQVVAKNSDSIFVSLNGKQVIDYKSSGIELKGSEVLIGQGYDSSRKFRGIIKNITLEEGAYQKNSSLSKKYFINYILALLYTSLILSIFFRELDSQDNPLTSLETFEVKSIIYAIILLFITSYFIGTIILGNSHVIIKWFLLILIAISYPLYEFSRSNRLNVSLFNKLIFTIIFLSYNFYLIKNNYIFFKSDFFFLLSLFSVAYTTLLISIFIKKFKLVTAICYSIAFNLLFIQILNLVSQLSNWKLLIENYINFPTYTTLLVFFSLSIITYLIFRDIFKAPIFNSRIKNRSAIDLMINVIPILIFLFISFRYDSLFISTNSGSPIYHWEYYIGVIRSIQNGGWLLWDTPSQYGFLNLVIASLFSLRNAYDSFYLFQGFLLFITSTSLYLSISKCFALSNIYKIFLFLLIFFSVFFADIEFIGPYPFPSSSVVRFFGAYLIIVIFCLFSDFNNKQRFLISLIFPFTFFWSAESAIYCTSIIIFVLTSLFIKLKKSCQPLTFFYGYVISLAMTYVISLITILIFYKLNIGQIPDFSGFFEFALGYASGYGSVPLKVMGPGNMLLLVFVGVIYLLITISNYSKLSSNFYISLLSACVGCIWGISTYFIGRPVAQNLTAILPLLVVVVFIATGISRFSSLTLSSISIRTIAIPIFFITLIPLWSPSWLSKAASFKYFSPNIENLIPVGQIEIEKHLLFLKDRGEKNIIFYGDGDDITSPNPYLTYTDNFIFGIWLPTPLQLLEPPIKQNRRQLYLTRYTCNHKFDSGSIIRRNNDPVLNARFAILSNDLNEKLFKTVETFSTDNYTTTIFRKRISPEECFMLSNN